MTVLRTTGTSIRWLLACLLALLIGSATFAQTDENGFQPLGQFSDLLGQQGSSGKRIVTSARFVADEATRTGILQIKADVAANWHVYAISQPEALGAPVAIDIVLYDSSDYERTSEFTPDKEPEIKNFDYISVPVHEHHGIVTWSASVEFAPGVDIKSVKIAGELAGQICEDEGVCMILSSKDGGFTAPYEGPVAQQTVTTIGTRGNGDAAGIAGSELAKYVGFGLLAGFILNFMPCVLPVIGLKVMSFVKQAGESRGQVFMLNFVFALGLLSVFLVLATFSAFFGMGWGDYLTKSMTGSVLITALVFAFGLSMLGVWEMPIPGMSGSSAAGKLSQKNGLIGAFFLGIFTTILATPCTGPFLGSALGFTASQPPWVTYLIFTAIGMGMAIPYLLIGINPSLVSWLPKPGPWMNTFKDVMGFVLLGTVIFLLVPFGSEPRNEYLVAMLGLLLTIGIACWWIGRTSLAAELPQKLRAWGIGLAIVAVGASVSFGMFGPSGHELDWQKFTAERLAELKAQNRIVFVDFTGPG